MDNSQSPHSELKSYQDAVWAYLLEHSDITENGAIFIKFHTKSRIDFEKHIKGRHVYGYHRVDQRTGESYIEKEQRANALREKHQTEKQLKREAWKATQEERRRMFAKLKRSNERRFWLQKHPLIHTAYRATACMGVSLRHLYEKLQRRHKGETKAQSYQESEG